MRIALVYPVLSRRGGVERYLHQLGAELARAHDVTLIVGAQEEPAPPGCRVVRLPYLARPWFLASITFSVASWAYLLRARFDVVNVHGASGFTRGVVTAHSCHRAWYRASRDALPRGSARWWLKVLNPLHRLTMLIERIQYRGGRRAPVISVSSSVARELVREYGIPPEDVVVIHSGVDGREFTPEKGSAHRRAVRERHGLSDTDFLLLFLGNEFRRKGLTTVLRALAEPGLEDARLLVAGKDDPAPYRREAGRLGVAGRVLFVGPADAAQLYGAADVFVMPTRYEAFALVLLEAMASGLPVVTTRTAGATELIRDGLDGLLLGDPDDARSVAGAVRRLRVPAVRSAMAAHALERVAPYTWERVAAQTLDVFRRATPEPRSEPVAAGSAG